MLYMYKTAETLVTATVRKPRLFQVNDRSFTHPDLNGFVRSQPTNPRDQRRCGRKRDGYRTDRWCPAVAGLSDGPWSGRAVRQAAWCPLAGDIVWEARALTTFHETRIAPDRLLIGSLGARGLMSEASLVARAQPTQSTRRPAVTEV